MLIERVLADSDSPNSSATVITIVLESDEEAEWVRECFVKSSSWAEGKKKRIFSSAAALLYQYLQRRNL